VVIVVWCSGMEALTVHDASSAFELNHMYNTPSGGAGGSDRFFFAIWKHRLDAPRKGP
jgi:hypothetical protein